jgi:hypothetical protein
MFVFGVLPSKIKNYNRKLHMGLGLHRTPMYIGLMEAVLDACKDFLWETRPRGPGLEVFNACTGQTMRVWITMARLMEDSVGLQKPGCCHYFPAKIGRTLYC